MEWHCRFSHQDLRRSDTEQFRAGLMAWLGEQIVRFRAAFDRARLDAIGSVADEMFRHVPQSQDELSTTTKSS